VQVLVDRIPPRTAGRIMVAVAAVGLVVAVVGTVVAWQLVGEVGGAAEESLAITDESVATIEDTIVVAGRVVDDVGAALGALDDVLVQLRDGTRHVEPVLTDVEALTSDVPVALGEFQETLDRVAGAAGEIDAILVQLARLPLAPSYDPETTLSAQLRQLSLDLDPVIDTLAGSGDDIAALRGTTTQLRTELAGLTVDVRAIVARMDESSELVGRYRDQAGRAGDLVADGRQDLDGSVSAMRLLVVLGGLVFAAGQLVPLWVGAGLLSSDPRISSR
jgi:methyl-accepting chemotaxis protein